MEIIYPGCFQEGIIKNNNNDQTLPIAPQMAFGAPKRINARGSTKLAFYAPKIKAIFGILNKHIKNHTKFFKEEVNDE